MEAYFILRIVLIVFIITSVSALSLCINSPQKRAAQSQLVSVNILQDGVRIGMFSLELLLFLWDWTLLWLDDSPFCFYSLIPLISKCNLEHLVVTLIFHLAFACRNVYLHILVLVSYLYTMLLQFSIFFMGIAPFDFMTLKGLNLPSYFLNIDPFRIARDSFLWTTFIISFMNLFNLNMDAASYVIIDP